MLQQLLGGAQSTLTEWIRTAGRRKKKTPLRRDSRRVRFEPLEDRELLAVSGGLWISHDELMALPTSGAAWDSLESDARRDISNPDISNQDDKTDSYTLAKALVGVRTGNQQYINDVRDTIMDAIDTEDGGRTLALGRNLVSYVIAADLVGLDSSDDTRFRSWLREVLDENLDGRTLTSTHEDRPNNWGTHAGASRAAAAIYLGDQAEIQRTAQVFKGWVGDRSSYAGFDFGGPSGEENHTWEYDTRAPVAINPVGATKSGHSIDGALPEEMRRGGSFSWPPNETYYAWEALQGAIVQAELLYRQGYDTWHWEDDALHRAVKFLHSIGWQAEGDDEWQIPLINARYGTDYRENADASPGKNVGWTAWTHQQVTPVPSNQNEAPEVDAGTSQTIVLPDGVYLNGTVRDDGLPRSPGEVTTKWSKISGPGTVTFDNASAIDTNARFSQPGSYVLSLAADDGQLDASDRVTITVEEAVATNQAPTVNAGADQIATPNSLLNLNGTVHDDGLPDPPGAVATTWAVVSGPGTVTFADASDVDTTARFSESGRYVLSLTADDGQLNASDRVTITVEEVPVSNQAPTVDAGADQVVGLGSPVRLDGTVRDDGLPDPPAAVATTWTMISGPGTVTFADGSMVDTTAQFSASGRYVLGLTADDGQLTASDRVTITVEATDSGNDNGSGKGSGTVTRSFQDGVDGYQGTRDTKILSRRSDRNYGSSTTLEPDGSPDQGALIAWDLSSIPAGAQVTAASIELNVTNRSLHTYEIYEMLRAWSESEATWEVAADGARWQQAGAAGSGDRGSAVLGVAHAESTGSITIELSAEGLTVVQSWIDQPETNFGLIFQDYTDAVDGLDFNSRETSTVSNRPKLNVTYNSTSTDDVPSTERLVFQNGVDGYDGTRDTKILSGSADENFGSATNLETDGSPDKAALVQWDLESIPQGSTVTGATIQLNVTNRTVHDYEIYELLRDWSEAGATWNQAGDGGGGGWDRAGAQGAGDRGDTGLGSVGVYSTGPVTIDLNAEGLAVVQSWIDQPETNFGLIFQDYTDAVDGLDFSSSEVSAIGDRPRLEVTFTPPQMAAPPQETVADAAIASLALEDAGDEDATDVFNDPGFDPDLVFGQQDWTPERTERTRPSSHRWARV